MATSKKTKNFIGSKDHNVFLQINKLNVYLNQIESALICCKQEIGRIGDKIMCNFYDGKDKKKKQYPKRKQIVGEFWKD